MSGRDEASSILYVAAELRAMAPGDPRRRTAGAMVTCRAVMVGLMILAIPVEMAGWHSAAGWMLATSVLAYAAEGIAGRLDDEVIRRQAEEWDRSIE